VAADQGARAGHAHDVQVIAEDHQVAGSERLVQAARGIGHDQRVRAQSTHHPHWKRDVAQAVALVIVDAAAHRDHGYVLQSAQHQLARVALHGRDRKVRDVRIRHDDRRLDLVRQIAQARAEDQRDSRLQCAARPDRIRGFAHAFGDREARLSSPGRTVGHTLDGTATSGDCPANCE
jgi:hypothetical protein